MPDADSILYAKQAAEREAQTARAASNEKLEKTKHAATAGRLYRLLVNDDVQWFLAEFVDPLIADEDKILNDRKTPIADRDIACHRKDMAGTIRGLIDAKHKEFTAKSSVSEQQ